MASWYLHEFGDMEAHDRGYGIVHAPERDGEAVSVYVPYRGDESYEVQRQRLIDWLNHIAPDGVLPPAPTDVTP